jgi:hypothetical protein
MRSATANRLSIARRRRAESFCSSTYLNILVQEDGEVPARLLAQDPHSCHGSRVASKAVQQAAGGQVPDLEYKYETKGNSENPPICLITLFPNECN